MAHMLEHCRWNVNYLVPYGSKKLTYTEQIIKWKLHDEALEVETILTMITTSLSQSLKASLIHYRWTLSYLYILIESSYLHILEKAFQPIVLLTFTCYLSSHFYMEIYSTTSSIDFYIQVNTECS